MNAPLETVFNLWSSDARISKVLTSAIDVGLGYLSLQQPARALSGGEVQRLRIAKELAGRSRDALYLLDEPTLGQHMDDVARLAGVLHRLVDAGASVVIVEHHLEMLAACDWLIELGPGGGPQGGALVGSGPPEELARGATPTGRALARLLAGST